MSNITVDYPANSTSCFQFDDEATYHVASILFQTFTVLSVLANILTLFFIVLFKRWSFFNQRLVLYLSLATMINYITSMLSVVDQICIIAAYAVQNGGWMNLNAYISITGTLLLKVFFAVNLDKGDILTVLFIFLSPFLFTWVPFIHSTYGKAGPVCWIVSIKEVNGTCEVSIMGEVLQLVLWYIPLYTILTIMIILYTLILIKFCFHRKRWLKSAQDVNSERKRAVKYIVSLLAYPVIYFLVNIFSFINRVYALRAESPSSVLWLLNSIFYPHQGLGIAIVFLVSIRKKLSLVNVKAAMGEWCHKSRIREYSFRDDKREMSFSSSYGRFGKKQENHVH